MKRLCVFCGSSPGARQSYADQAIALGQLLVKNEIELVYGGGRVGLMGTIADAVMAAGGKTIGVIPEALMQKEIGHAGLTQLFVVKSMHERKAMMADLSDAFIAMPGGFGTMEEMCEILAWGQLGIHSKPFGVLNVDHFYDGFLQFCDHAVAEKLLKPKHRSLMLESSDPAELLTKMKSWKPEHEPKWITKAET